MLKPKSTDCHVRFITLPTQTPWLTAYWDFQTNDPACVTECMEADIGAWSYAEPIMAQFWVIVWFGENRLQFDAIEAASVLDQQYRTVRSALLAVALAEYVVANPLERSWPIQVFFIVSQKRSYLPVPQTAEF